MSRVAVVTAERAESVKHIEGSGERRLQSRRQLRRQRRGGTEIQGRDGVAVYKWDVSAYESVPPASSKSKPILVRSRCWSQMAGITRDTMFHV